MNNHSSLRARITCAAIILLAAITLSAAAWAQVGRGPSRTVYVEPGVNKISEAARNLSNGSGLILGFCDYKQTEPIVIPAGVTSFEILGMGPGSSRVRFTADCDGIVTSTSGNFADMIERCRIENLSLEMAGSSGERTAIRVWASETNVYINPSVSIRNVTIDRVDGGGYWGVGIDLIGAKEFIIDDVHIRHMPRLNAGYQAKGVGVRLQSCVCGSLRDVQVNEARLAVDIVKAEDRYIVDPNKHGCEGITFDGFVIYKVVDGFSLGEKALNMLFSNGTIASVQRYAIYEPSFDANGGYHSIRALWIDSDPTWTVPESGAILLRRPGTVVDGINVSNTSAVPWHGVILTSGAPISAVDKCMFRACGYSVFVQSYKNTISRNKSLYTRGGCSILITPGAFNNVIGGNIMDGGIMNQGQGNKVIDNMGY